MRSVLFSILLTFPLVAEVVSPPEMAAPDSTMLQVPPTEVVVELVTPVQTEPATAATKKMKEPVELKNSVLEKLTLGGSFQVRGNFRNMSAESDSNKEFGLSLSKFRVDLEGAYNEHFGILGQFQLEANGKNVGIENAYAYYKQGYFQLKAGKTKKPFSMEALQSSTGLYTVERGQLYANFLSETTGYSSYDVGLLGKGGFTDEGTEVTYELGVFNGKQSLAGKGYGGAQYEGKDAGFKAKDIVGRLALKGFGGLETELAFSIKSADKKNGPALDPKFNAAYEAGLAYELANVRFQGEMAWGSNHKGNDSLIVNSSAEFFAFYSMLIWRHDYSKGRASESVIKFEGLDPDMTIGSGGGLPNDGKFRYTLGINYFFTPKISILTSYGVTDPITKIKADNHLTHDLDMMWRLNF